VFDSLPDGSISPYRRLVDLGRSEREAKWCHIRNPVTGSHPVVSLPREKIMKNFASSIVNFLKEEDGPTAVEYAVMLALIVVVCLTAITAVGTAASAKFQQVATAISN